LTAGINPCLSEKTGKKLLKHEEVDNTMIHHTYSSAVEAVLQFLIKDKDGIFINDEDNLLELKILDSLQFMGLIFLLEEITEVQIDVSEFDILNVSTISNIKKFYLSPLQVMEDSESIA